MLLGCRSCFIYLVGLHETFLNVEHETPFVRETAAKALSAALPAQPEVFSGYLNKLMDLYHEKVGNFKA
jgi:hypothetical protein